jgi:hypothetical protein
MVLVAVGLGVLAVLGVGAALWFLVPTLRSLGGPDFEPTYTDDETVFQVEQKFTPGAGGGGV